MIEQFLIKLVAAEVFTIFCSTAVIGFIGLIYDLYSLIKQKSFGEKYLSKYEQWTRISSDEEGYQLLRWLRRNWAKMENQMGENRMLHFYINHSANQGMLDRHIGTLDDDIFRKLRQLINPLVWLTRFVRLILADMFPWILRSIGLISGNTESEIRNSSLSSKIIGIVTLLGSVTSILAGWNSLVKFFNQIFGWLSFVF